MPAARQTIHFFTCLAKNYQILILNDQKDPTWSKCIHSIPLHCIAFHHHTYSTKIHSTPFHSMIPLQPIPLHEHQNDGCFVRTWFFKNVNAKVVPLEICSILCKFLELLLTKFWSILRCWSFFVKKTQTMNNMKKKKPAATPTWLA